MLLSADFTKRLEPYFYVGITLFALLFTFLNPEVSKSTSQVVHMVSGILFLNSTHVILTFSLYLGIFKSSKVPALNSKRFWIGLIFIAASIVSLMLIERIYDPIGVRLGILFLFFTASRHHGISQTYGLLSQDNFNHVLKFRLSKLDVFAAWFLPSAIFVATTLKLESFIFMFCVSILFQLKVIATYFRSEKFNWSSFSYLSRYLLHMNSGINYWFIIGPAFIHGIEYLYYYSRVTKKNDLTGLSKKAYAAVFLSVPIFFLVHYSEVLRIYLPHFIYNTSAFYAFIVLGKVISFSHFYFDSYMFRFKDEETRKTLIRITRAS